jgi:hypothetical protein
MRKLLLAIVGIVALALVMIPLAAQQPPAGQRGAAQGTVQTPAPPAGQGAAQGAGRAGQAPGAQAAGRGMMMGRGVQAIPTTMEETPPKVPVGFTPIFNGKDLTGWHISKTNHHGTTPDFHVLHGMIVATQNPLGQGGILLTDKKYGNVEVYMEIKPDWGCDGGLFFWSDERGRGYQVMLDYLPGGTMVTGVYGEMIQGTNFNGPGWANLTNEQRQEIQRTRTEAWQKAWKREEWNSVRARIQGNPPRITTWLNDQIMFQGTDTENHAIDGATEGSIAIQVHGMERWRAGGFWRWRVIAVKELPATAARGQRGGQ